MEIYQIPLLRHPVMIAAFSGWSDAGEAASGALTHLLENLDQSGNAAQAILIAEYEPEDFYDFQVNRPQVSIDDSSIRNITWPSTQIFGLEIPSMDRDLVIVTGVEPSMRWKTFTTDLLDLADDLEVSLVVTLGSLLADTPHSRPITVTGTGAHPNIAERLGVSVSKYEGPTGILGIIQDGCMRRGIDAISLWAAVPHYASASPSPKASLALINSLEDFLDVDADLFKELSVSPNPATDFIAIENVAGLAYQLTDLSGKVLLSGTTQMQNEIHISDLNAGIYNIRFEKDGAVKAIKVIKM